MARNVEIKARIADRWGLEQRAARIGGVPKVLIQEDTFFNVPSGRLKLRVEGGKGQLIYYERENCAGPKACDYSIAHVSDPSSLKTVLSAALGVRAVVYKRRTLYIAGQARMHIDEVEGLGDFVELEVVLAPAQSAEEGASIADELMRTLEIRPEDLVRGAYVDLLTAAGKGENGRQRSQTTTHTPSKGGH